MASSAVAVLSAEEIAGQADCEIAEVSNLTHPIAIPRDGRGPLLLVRAGLPARARRKAVLSLLMGDMLELCDSGSVLSVLRSLYQTSRGAVAAAIAVTAWAGSDQATTHALGRILAHGAACLLGMG